MPEVPVRLLIATVLLATARDASACECSRTTTVATRVAAADAIVEGAIVEIGPITPNMAPLAERAAAGVSDVQRFRLHVTAVLKPGPVALGDLDVVFQHCNTAPLTRPTEETRVHFLELGADGRLTTHFCDWFFAGSSQRADIVAAVAELPPSTPLAAPPPPPAPTPDPLLDLDDLP